MNDQSSTVFSTPVIKKEKKLFPLNPKFGQIIKKWTGKMALIGSLIDGISSVMSLPFRIDEALITDNGEGPIEVFSCCKFVYPNI